MKIRILYEVYKKLLNPIHESKKTESEATNILKKYGIDSTDEVLSKLKGIDSSNNQVLLPYMAYFYTKGGDDIQNMKIIFERFLELSQKNRITAPVFASNSDNEIILKVDGDAYDNFIDFSSLIDGLYNKFTSSDNYYKSYANNFKADHKPIWSGNNIDIYYGKDFKTCIAYTMGGLTNKKYSFCIGNPTMRMFQSYRDTKVSTFYYIVDKNKFVENEDGSLNLDNPLHMVVLDKTKNGIELTDANNTTGTIAEYGTDVEGYIKYLQKMGVPVEKMVNVPKSPQELEDDRVLGRQNTDLDWFKDLSYDMKSKYIGRGHMLSDAQFDYLLGS